MAPKYKHDFHKLEISSRETGLVFEKKVILIIFSENSFQKSAKPVGKNFGQDGFSSGVPKPVLVRLLWRVVWCFQSRYRTLASLRLGVQESKAPPCVLLGEKFSWSMYHGSVPVKGRGTHTSPQVETIISHTLSSMEAIFWLLSLSHRGKEPVM